MPSTDVRIPLRNRYGDVVEWATVDVADAHLVDEFNWHLKHGYASRNQKRPDGPGHYFMPMHRQILGLEPGDGWTVDHLDRDRLNNRRVNLRKCTKAENAQNRPSHGGRSKYRGVGWNEARGLWVAYGGTNRERTYLGAFEDEDEAGRVAAEWRRVNMPFSVEAKAA